MWKIATKLFKHLATFAEFLDNVEGFGGAEQRLFCWSGAKVGITGVRESSVKLLGFKKATARDFGNAMHSSVQIRPFGVLIFYIRLDKVTQVLERESGDVR